jgi:hypothetical protein
MADRLNPAGLVDGIRIHPQLRPEPPTDKGADQPDQRPGELAIWAALAVPRDFR